MSEARCRCCLGWLAGALLCGAMGADAQDANGRLALNGPRETVTIASTPELQARRARIGRIDIQVDDVFETSRPLATPYRVVNGLHIATGLNTIAQQLLFREGDSYNPRILDETERLLRAQRYLSDATITPVRYNADDNTVDVRVRVHDVWTLSPGFSFGRKGGENSTSLKFEDTNFLGLGKQLAAARVSDVDRTSWRIGYADPNVFGSWWRLSTAYADASDGGEQSLAIERPFYALDARWSANASARDATSTIARYSEGLRIGAFEMHERRLAFGGGTSKGLRDGWARRFLAGFESQVREFSGSAELAGGAAPDDRTCNYPWVGFELIEDQYISTRNLDQIGRTEDLQLGRSARATMGFASRALGSTEDAIILGGEGRVGFDLGSEQYLIQSLALSGRMQGGTLANAVLDWQGRYYRRQSERRVLFAALGGALTQRPDAETQLLLGGDNGLRGYPLRYQAGAARALFTLEERFYTQWQPLKLFNVGAAIFFDAGRAWGRDPYAQAPQGWLKDVGIGLRLGSVRSAHGNVLHIDLAAPLDRAEGVDGVQLLIETRRSF